MRWRGVLIYLLKHNEYKLSVHFPTSKDSNAEEWKKNGNKLIFRERKLIGFRTRDEEILMGLVDKINYK